MKCIPLSRQRRLSPVPNTPGVAPHWPSGGNDQEQQHRQHPSTALFSFSSSFPSPSPSFSTASARRRAFALGGVEGLRQTNRNR